MSRSDDFHVYPHLVIVLYVICLIVMLPFLILLGAWWLMIPKWRGRIRTILQGREYG